MLKKVKSSSVDKKKQNRSVDSSEDVDNAKAKRVGSKEGLKTASSTTQQNKEVKRKSLNRQKPKKSRRSRRKIVSRSVSSTEHTYTQDETSDDDEKIRQKRSSRLSSRRKKASKEKTDSEDENNAVQKRQKPKPLSGNVSRQQELTANNATDPIKTAQDSPRKRQPRKPDAIVKRPPTIEEPEGPSEHKFYRPFPNFYFPDSASTDGSFSNRTTRTDQTTSPGVASKNQFSLFRSDLPIDESNVPSHDNKAQFPELPKKDDENEGQH